MKNFTDLSGRELLALAIALEEEDARIFADYAEQLRVDYPDTAQVFSEMMQEETEHRHRLLSLYRDKYGEHIPLIQRHHVRGFVERKPVWLAQPLNLDKVREQISIMEKEVQQFYHQAAKRTDDVTLRQLFGDLAAEEEQHIATAQELQNKFITPDIRDQEWDTQRRQFLLQIVQPGLAGLMDGTVSTLAPLFAAAFATHDPRQTFLVGLAAAIGAGISMGFAEGLSDTGSFTGRGKPWIRGFICGWMTTLGGLGHALPYLIPDFRIATTIAIVVVLLELGLIAWIRNRYMDSPLLSSTVQVVIGGLLVFAVGILIGTA